MFSLRERRALEKAALLLVPDDAFSHWVSEAISRLEDYLLLQPRGLFNQLRILLALFPLASVLFVRKPLRQLSQSEGEDLWQKLERVPIRKLRQGLWGLKNLIFLVYYTDERSFPSLGYEGPVEDRGEGAALL